MGIIQAHHPGSELAILLLQVAIVSSLVLEIEIGCAAHTLQGGSPSFAIWVRAASRDPANRCEIFEGVIKADPDYVTMLKALRRLGTTQSPTCAEIAAV